MSGKLDDLRYIMIKKGIDAYIIPGSDAHQSEYIADYWCTRQWLSGFTGSNGLVAVTEDEAGLWTDGRYFAQAEQELAKSGIELFKMNEKGVPTYSRWLAQKLLKATPTIGFDGRVLSLREFEKLKSINKKATFKYNEDIAGDLWKDRPPLPIAPAFVHDITFTGKSSEEKLKLVRDQMQKKHAHIYLVAALDDIAWLANIRGSDIQNTPVVYSYLLITMDHAYLFIDEQKFTDNKFDNKFKDKFEKKFENKFTLCPYQSVFDYVREISQNKSILYDPGKISVKLFDAIPDTAKSIRSDSIIAELKAIKNHIEIKNMQNAFIKEGVVMVQFLKWLSEQDLTGQKTAIYEMDIQAKISKLRQIQKYNLGDSFTTIAAYGENAAIVHYSPKVSQNSKLKPEGFLLVDTGGQYLDGTTDITRTIVLGPLTQEMRRDFTLVLKGHIALARSKFLQGATGTNLDILARQYLWQEGKDYKHGTGHGIGYCLGVHEGPHNIHPKINKYELVPGMLCTNEPGLYKKGHYGIRLENVMLVKESVKNEYGTFLEFQIMTLCPIDTTAIDVSLLNQEEIDFLNGYHRQVYETLSPYLSQSEREWLKDRATSFPKS